MNSWREALDAAVSGKLDPARLPPHMQFLSLPPISRWQGRTVTIDWEAPAQAYQSSGVIFGGYLSAVADYAAGTAMLTVLEGQQTFATHKLEIEYKRPVKAGMVTVEAEVVDGDERRYRVEVRFINVAGELCAEATVHQTLLRAR